MYKVVGCTLDGSLCLSVGRSVGCMEVKKVPLFVQGDLLPSYWKYDEQPTSSSKHSYSHLHLKLQVNVNCKACMHHELRFWIPSERTVHTGSMANAIGYARWQYLCVMSPSGRNTLIYQLVFLSSGTTPHLWQYLKSLGIEIVCL